MGILKEGEPLPPARDNMIGDEIDDPHGCIAHDKRMKAVSIREYVSKYAGTIDAMNSLWERANKVSAPLFQMRAAFEAAREKGWRWDLRFNQFGEGEIEGDADSVWDEMLWFCFRHDHRLHAVKSGRSTYRQLMARHVQTVNDMNRLLEEVTRIDYMCERHARFYDEYEHPHLLRVVFSVAKEKGWRFVRDPYYSNEGEGRFEDASMLDKEVT